MTARILPTLMASAILMTSGLAAASVFDERTVWYPEVEELFEADRYCSPESAARALARRLVDDLRKVAQDDHAVRASVTVKGEDTSWINAESVRWAFKEALHQTDKPAIGRETADQAHPVSVELAYDVGSENAGTLRMQLESPRLSRTWSANFVNKSWVDRDQLTKDLVCVRGLAGNSEFADRDVLDRAIEEELVDRVLRRGGNRLSVHSSRERQQLRELLARQLERSDIVRDQFRQTFYRPSDGVSHAAISREAMLLDLSEENLDQLTRHVVSQFRGQQQQRKGAMYFGAMSMVMVLLVGLAGNTALNHMTRGYYVWPIRFATTAYLLISGSVAATITFFMLTR